jgi:hypothetical protein
MKRLVELREESSGQTRMLWHSSCWDGPQSGVMLWNGEMTWFSMNDEKYTETLMPDDEWKEWVEYYKEKYGTEPHEDDRVDYDRTRYFKVYRLPKDVMEAIKHNHELFRNYVGTHTDYDESGRRGKGATIGTNDLGDLKPYKNHMKFYHARTNDSWLVRLFPFFFKKENIQMKYKWDLASYTVIGEFEDY